MAGQVDDNAPGTLTLIGTMRLKPEHEAEFREFAAATIQKVRAEEPETLLYALHEHSTDPHTYVWVERYRDADALRAHTEAPYNADAMNRLSMWLAAPPELIQLTQLLP